jgi:hypothetical protein
MQIDLEQVIFALERAARLQDRRAQRLAAKRDYSAELWDEDAQRLREAITLLQPLLAAQRAGERAVPPV